MPTKTIDEAARQDIQLNWLQNGYDIPKAIAYGKKAHANDEAIKNAKDPDKLIRNIFDLSGHSANYQLNRLSLQNALAELGKRQTLEADAEHKAEVAKLEKDRDHYRNLLQDAERRAQSATDDKFNLQTRLSASEMAVMRYELAGATA